MEIVETTILDGKNVDEKDIQLFMDTMVYPTTPQKILILIKGLNRNLIDPDIILTEGIKNANKKEDLIPICLALRYNADPNLYISFPKVGNIHVLGYCYLNLDNELYNDGDCTSTNSQNRILNSIIVTLKLAGSNWELPIFKKETKKETDKCGNNKNKDNNEDENPIMDISLFNPVSGKSVSKWLMENYKNSIIPFKISDVKGDTLNAVSIYLDMDNHLCKTPSIEQMIASHSDSLFNKYVCNDKNKDWSKDALLFSIIYLNLSTFEKAIDEGEELRFYQVSTILSMMKKFKDEEDMISFSQLMGMLTYAVENGTYIDQKHLEFLNELDIEAGKELKTKYEVPMWEKYCKNCKGKVSDRLKKLAYRLNILGDNKDSNDNKDNKDNQKKKICDTIKKINNADKEEVKNAVIKRQETRITSTLSSYLSYVQNDPQIIIRNRSLLNNVYDYPDNDIVFYKDTNEVCWIFTRNYFKQLAQSGKNPYTNSPLPQLLIDEMVKRDEFYNDTFKDEDYSIVPISKTIDNLGMPHLIDGEYGNRGIYKMKLKWGCDETPPVLTEEEMSDILEDLVKDEVHLENLSEDLAMTTFAVTLMESDPLKVEEIMQNLKLSYKLKTKENPLLTSKKVRALTSSEGDILESSNKGNFLRSVNKSNKRDILKIEDVPKNSQKELLSLEKTKKSIKMDDPFLL